MGRLFVLSALLFALPAHAVAIEWVEIGDPRNPAYTEVMTTDGTTRYGSAFAGKGSLIRELCRPDCFVTPFGVSCPSVFLVTGFC